MGAAGKKLLGGGSRHKSLSPGPHVKDGAYGLPAHPVSVRRGQRYYPRRGRRGYDIEVRRIDVIRGRAIGVRLTEEPQLVELALGRVLATRDDGQGAHYQFMGFKPGRYVSYAFLLGTDSARAMLVLPEWHPGRPVHLPRRVLPIAAGPSSWLRCTAELDAPNAGRLSIRDFSLVEDPGRGTCPLPTLGYPTHARAPIPSRGEGCGDIVVRLDPLAFEKLGKPERPVELYLPGAHPRIAPGGVMYAAHDGHVYGAVTIAGLHRRPMGSVLEIDRVMRRVDPCVPVREQRLSPWAWRWWELSV